MKLRVPDKEIGRFIVLLFFLMPFVNIPDFNYVQGWEWLGAFSSALRLLRVFNLALGCSIVLVLGIVRKLEISLGCILCILPYGYLVVRTALAGGTRELQNLFVFLMMLLLTEIFLLKNEEWFLTLVDVMNFYTWINFLFILRYVWQGGLISYSVRQQRYWAGYYFLGYDNALILIVLPLIELNLVLYHYGKNRKYLLMIGIQIISEILVSSVTSLGILIAFTMFLLCRNRKLICKILYRPTCALWMYFTFFCVMIGVMREQKFFNAVLSKWIGKNIESARLSLWEIGIQKAKEYFFLGEGYNMGAYRTYYKSPHTMLLEWMGQGGIVFAILNLLAIYFSLRQLYKNKQHYEALVIYNGIIAFMLGYTFESYGIHTIFWTFPFVLLIGANIERFHTLLQDKVSFNENRNF